MLTDSEMDQTGPSGFSIEIRIPSYVGLPQQCSEEILLFWPSRTELALLVGCVLWSSRVVVPKA